eukprot:m.175244 g.175244  ORF g.175244 m.175244 type:complete len:394 (+) comp15420_c0_seq12:473-1654(+)
MADLQGDTRDGAWKQSGSALSSTRRQRQTRQRIPPIGVTDDLPGTLNSPRVDGPSVLSPSRQIHNDMTDQRRDRDIAQTRRRHTRERLPQTEESSVLEQLESPRNDTIRDNTSDSDTDNMEREDATITPHRPTHASRHRRSNRKPAPKALWETLEADEIVEDTGDKTAQHGREPAKRSMHIDTRGKTLFLEQDEKFREVSRSRILKLEKELQIQVADAENSRNVENGLDFSLSVKYALDVAAMHAPGVLVGFQSLLYSFESSIEDDLQFVTVYEPLSGLCATILVLLFGLSAVRALEASQDSPAQNRDRAAIHLLASLAFVVGLIVSIASLNDDRKAMINDEITSFSGWRRRNVIRLACAIVGLVLSMIADFVQQGVTATTPKKSGKVQQSQV